MLSLFFSLSAMADQAIYDGLQVKEVDKTAGRMGATTFEKSVGGLVCTKTTVVAPNATPEYRCAIRDRGRSDAEIYNAIPGKEVNKTPKGALGATMLEKKIGRLSCQKREVVYPNAQPTFECRLERSGKAPKAAEYPHGRGLIFNGEKAKSSEAK